MARHLITGGSGFVGAEIAAALADRGDTVVAFDLRSSPRIETLVAGCPNVSFVAGEITEWPAVAAVIQDLRPDAIVHCAAIVGVRASLDAPMQTMRVNVEGSLTIMEAMRLFGVRRMVHMSSEETYGHFHSDVITEDHPSIRSWPMAYRKWPSSTWPQLRRALRARVPQRPHKLGLRPPPAASARSQDADRCRGKRHPASHGFRRGFQGGPHLYRRSDRRTLLVLDHVDHPFNVYHIASGTAPSLAEIAAVIRELVPSADLALGPGTIEFAPGIKAWKKGALDITRATRTLGYRPRYDLRAGIAATLKAQSQGSR